MAEDNKLEPKNIWQLDKLHNWDKNPRSISDKGFERLKKQIQTLGMYKPLLITDDGTVLGGNMRLRAYKDLGITDVWVSIVDAPTEEKKLEYALSDNDRAGFYDDDLLANLTAEMPEFNWGDYSVDLKEPTNLQDLLDQFKEVVEDEVPEIDDTPAVSKLGEVYQLGRHRLMCGDSTKIEDVEKLMDGKKADMVFTDPPYGIDVVQSSSVGGGGMTKFGSVGGEKMVPVNKYSPIINDNSTQTARDAFNLCVSQGIEKQIYWGGNYFTDFLPPSPCWLIWNKKNTGNFADVEMAWTNFKTGAKLYDFLWNGLSREGDRASGLVSRVHPTQKPVGLHVNILKDYSDEENIVLDLFGGSGSTLIACEQTNRTCFMMELDPKYCDVIRKRYAKFIGKENQWQTI
ncbi:MAG TPA: DNA methyltransferase [Patescibacteria group bacterium]